MLRIKTIDQMTRIGRILANYNKSRLLTELAKGPMPKGKIKDVLGVKASTVTVYVSELIDEGLVNDTPILKDGKSVVHMVRLAVNGLVLELLKVEEEKGWKHE